MSEKTEQQIAEEINKQEEKELENVYGSPKPEEQKEEQEEKKLSVEEQVNEVKQKLISGEEVKDANEAILYAAKQQIEADKAKLELENAKNTNENGFTKEQQEELDKLYSEDRDKYNEKLIEFTKHNNNVNNQLVVQDRERLLEDYHNKYPNEPLTTAVLEDELSKKELREFNDRLSSGKLSYSQFLQEARAKIYNKQVEIPQDTPPPSKDIGSVGGTQGSGEKDGLSSKQFYENA